MKICTIYGATLRVHPLFPVFLIAYALAGQVSLTLAYLLALLLHECGHWLVASRMSLPIVEMELTPFGGVMQIPLSDGLTGWPAFRLAAAGIAVNICCILLSFLALRVQAQPFWAFFLLANATMALINLLPVLPLDGGRMLLALLSARYSRPRVFRALLLAGRLLAAFLAVYGLILACLGTFRPFWCVCGCYLLYASALEERHGAARYLAALFSRRFRMDNGSALPVQSLCVSGDLPLFTLLPQLKPRAYHQVYVADDTAGEIMGLVSENKLYEAVLHTPSARMRDLMTRSLQK